VGWCRTLKKQLGVGIYPRNPTRPTKPADPINRPPARKTINGRIRILFYFLIGFRAGLGFHVFGRVDTRPPDHLIINIKNIYKILNPHFLTRLSPTLKSQPPSLSLPYSQSSLFVFFFFFFFSGFGFLPRKSSELTLVVEVGCGEAGEGSVEVGVRRSWRRRCGGWRYQI
jgi:hypothetical protein